MQRFIITGDEAKKICGKLIASAYEKTADDNFPEPYVTGFFREGGFFTAFDNVTKKCYIETFDNEEQAMAWCIGEWDNGDAWPVKNPISTKEFILNFTGDRSVGINSQTWCIKGEFDFDNRASLEIFKLRLLETWEYISDSPISVETQEEFNLRITELDQQAAF